MKSFSGGFSKLVTRWSLLGLMGYKISGAQSNIGLEQEFFLVPRDAYCKRPDLQQALARALVQLHVARVVRAQRLDLSGGAKRFVSQRHPHVVC